jgi:hypothetical protein
MNRLKVPEFLAGAYLDRNDAVAEQVGSGAVTAVHVVGDARQRQIDNARLIVGAGERPEVPGARVAPRIVFPRLVPFFTGLGMMRNVQRSLPVRTSNARTSPGGPSILLAESCSTIAEPMTMTSRTTSGAEPQV